MDESGRPIAGAVVSDGHNRVFSAEDGTFYFYTAADSILVQRLGYLPRRVAFRVIAKPIVLKAEPVTLPKVTVTQSARDLLAMPPDRISLPIDPDRHYYSAGEIISSTPSASTGGVRLAGESQGISILGNLSRHTLVLLDGIPLNPDGASYDISLLEAGEIESIELIKNNASVYGGSSAIGGIVSITTKKGAHQSGEKFALSTEAGSFGYAKNTFTFETAWETWKLRLHLANLDTDNDFPYRMPDWWSADSTATRENNAKRQNSISASFSIRVNKARILLRSDLSSFRRGLPGTVNFLEVYRNAFLEGSAGRNQITVDSDFLGCEASTLLWLNLDRTLYDNTRAPLTVYLSKYRQTMRDLGLRGSLGKELTFGSRISFTAGFAGEAGTRHYVNSDLLGAQADLDHYSRFANASLKGGLKLDLDDMIWDSSAAGRYDYGNREENFSWRLESSLRRVGRIETTLGATLGTSFSLPSPYDLYWRGDSQALGNPDLESESSRGWQFWLQNRLEPFSLKAAFHHNEIENLIQWRQ
ncbi:MAG: TonB-dependent receptor, partial [Candidatus Syntrophosphaera sp.]